MSDVTRLRPPEDEDPAKARATIAAFTKSLKEVVDTTTYADAFADEAGNIRKLGDAWTRTFTIDSGGTPGRIKKEIGEIREAVNQLREERGTSGKEIQEQIAAVAEKLQNLEASAAALTAPVLIPSRADLALRLVPIDTVRRIEEYSEDVALYLCLAGITGGAGLSTALAGQPIPWPLVALLLAMTVVFLWRAVATRQRKKGLKETEPTYSPVRVVQPESTTITEEIE